MELRRISKDGISRALEKADRYRLLNEPAEAESICADVLAVDPENEHALVTLVLAYSDQFGQERLYPPEHTCQELLARVQDPYKHAYYSGVVCERRAKAAVVRQHLHSHFAHDCLQEALGWYERAQAIRPAGNDDAILRWNACARALSHNPRLRERLADEPAEPYFD
jgi:hypothetical protein